MAVAEEEPDWFADALQARPSTRGLLVDGTAVALRSWGDGPLAPVVLVHGGGAHGRWWDHVAPLLATDRRVIALDLAGHGDSGRRPAYSFDSWADDVQAVVEDVGARPVLVGHSLGGMISCRLAQRAAGLLDGLLVLDSVIGAPTSDPADRGSYVASGPTRRYDTEAQAIARWRPVPFQRCPPWILEHVAAASVRRYDDGWSWKFDHRVFADEIYLPLPDEPVGCRSAFLRAEHGLVDEVSAQRTGAALGCSVIATVPAAGHHLMLDRPLELVSALRVLLSAWNG